MEDLIKALTIFSKYSKAKRPTHCEHDVLLVAEIKEDTISQEDVAELDKL